MRGWPRASPRPSTIPAALSQPVAQTRPGSGAEDASDIDADTRAGVPLGGGRPRDGHRAQPGRARAARGAADRARRPRDGLAVTASLASVGPFRLKLTRDGSGWLVAGQSLAGDAHTQRLLLYAEIIAGPFLLLAMFFGSLVVGLRALAPVEQSRRRQLEFTADASHELRTPLSVIRAEADVALSAPREAAEYRDALSRIQGESQRLRQLVDDMLWLARFDSRPPPPGDEPVDLATLAQACADRFRAVGPAVSAETPDGAVLISAPPEWIDRLAGVLVDNACRHAGPDGQVRIEVHAQGSRVSLTVEDSGPGIPEAERPRLFDRFHRSHRARLGRRPGPGHRRLDRPLDRRPLAHRRLPAGRGAHVGVLAALPAPPDGCAAPDGEQRPEATEPTVLEAQGQPDDGTQAGSGVAQRHRAAVGLGGGPHDGQAEAGASSSPVRFRALSRRENRPNARSAIRGGDPWPVVGHGQHGPAVVARTDTHTWLAACRTALSSRFTSSRRSASGSPATTHDACARRCRPAPCLHRHPGRGVARRDRGAHRGQVGGPAAQGLPVQPGEQQQVLGQPGQPQRVGVHVARRLGPVQAVRVIEGHLELGADAGDRAAQLVRGVRDQVPLALLRVGEPGEHVVQRDGERPHLVPGGRHRQVTRHAGLGHLGGAAAQLGDRPQRVPGDQPGDQGQQAEQQRRPDEQGPGQRGRGCRWPGRRRPRR